jgi:hypothetical protein
MFSKLSANGAIGWLTAVLVTFLAGAAFILSYDVLHALALASGITPSLAWLWPLCLDAFMIAASLAVLRGNLNRERTAYPWLLVGAFTALSMAFNVQHAGADLVARGIYILPPLVCFLGFELLMGQVKAAIQRRGIVSTLDELSAQAQARMQKLSALGADLETLTGKKDALRAEIAALRKEKRAETSAVPSVSDDTRAKALEILTANPNISGGELGRMLERSDSLGRKLRRELMPLVSGNGHGAG